MLPVTLSMSYVESPASPQKREIYIYTHRYIHNMLDIYIYIYIIYIKNDG